MTVRLFPSSHLKRLLFLLIAAMIAILMTVNVTTRYPRGADLVDHSTEDAWLDLLCPKYRFRDVSSETKLVWEEPDEDTIFFTDTSCGYGFGGRQACALESAARHHPNRTVQLLTTSPTLNLSLPFYQVLLALPNVKVSWMDLNAIFSPGPLEEWHRDRRWMIVEGGKGIFVSDASRSELLRRFGGTYHDLDVLTLRPLPPHTNYIGRLDATHLNGAVMSFRPHHHFLTKVIEDIPKVFDPFQCCTIGPDLLTSHLHRLCPENFTLPKTTDTDAMETCTDVTIYPSPAFYPIYWYPDELQNLFTAGKRLGEKFLKETKAYTLHLYNSLSKKELVYSGGDSIMETVFKTHCPKVYSVVLENRMWI